MRFRLDEREGIFMATIFASLLVAVVDPCETNSR